MIPARPTPEQITAYVANILTVYRAATPDQYSRGCNWYPTAHELALMVGDGNARKGAGVIAALSANKGWADNVRLATDAAAGHIHGHVGDALRKVTRIMDGEDPADVLPMDSKTGHFFQCISDPDDPTPVVIDRHAHDIAVGEVYGDAERGLSAKGRYSALATAYRQAATIVGDIPSVVQAVTWTVQVDRLSGVGTRRRTAPVEQS